MNYLAFFAEPANLNTLIGLYTDRENAELAINNYIKNNKMCFELDRINTFAYRFYIIPLNTNCDYNINFDYLYRLYNYVVPSLFIEEVKCLKKQHLENLELEKICKCFTDDKYNCIVSNFNDWLQISSQSIYYPIEDYRQTFLTLLQTTKGQDNLPDLQKFHDLLSNIYWNHSIYNDNFKNEIVDYLNCWYKHKTLNL